ncbi:MAG: SGNH/GDSL hydrolase family protein [Gammaproteobacteria bacterium]|uniref:SGNH/GDSL hydrolase family protein n=1 Tax=Rhodoferax sp. TaxID=50421 RepID=UPI00185D5CAB|nr:SGNH/GDSL hydrolase family protein [Rhodoferax sp.]MBU3897686.1 SGNH/GDSL hydrolase family protein [Gammaproteobacteria bacterium]MBA3056326.1 SGNH/GDSL hydrolase family protein [Rhodoferax sp.]MBU3998728.1 SGNH/GDSL hydrolase family protein [Gammaproteobacteria bacterium]MBU4080062.1 SGNH/GDSL hydrolase family protein [Gammaproteobacteria bacterium]MBU4112181.1 SGNH/GDSL hydrolase family protein [Gammaproteobacteria bacterium]
MRDFERYLWLTLLAPVLWLQGRHVRLVTPRLPEPPGLREGTSGQGPLLRVLIAGDSAAAGVGAPSQDEALCGKLVSRLSQHCTVEWRLLAVNGLDSPGLLKLLEETAVRSFDVVVVSIGVNDVTGLRSPSEWLHWQRRLAAAIEQRFEPKLLIHTAVPPMHGFTALPRPLRWFLGRWAIEMNRQLAASLVGQPLRAFHVPFQGAGANGLAADGFHPGPIGYAMWAQGLSQLILASPTQS